MQLGYDLKNLDIVDTLHKNVDIKTVISSNVLEDI